MNYLLLAMIATLTGLFSPNNSATAIMRRLPSLLGRGRTKKTDDEIFFRDLFFKQLDGRLDGMDRRLNGLHDKITEVEKNLGGMITKMKSDMDEKFTTKSEMDEKFTQIKQLMIYWSIYLTVLMVLLSAGKQVITAILQTLLYVIEPSS